jgi:D-glycero-alpha-D-manno-heptose-7-phosphate kinase
MIISKTPLRMSFVGGGSDLPAYYQQFGGAVISTAINHFVYVNVNPKFDQGIRVGYAKNEEVKAVAQIEHPLVRNALTLLKIHGGIEITTIADIPSSGTGLGSSSTFTVGLLNALHAYLGNSVSALQLAQEACHVELDLCQDPIGKQDQYASALGGFNFIEFAPDGSVQVQPMTCSAATQTQLQAGILLFYTGKTRLASDLLRRQGQLLSASTASQEVMAQMVGLAYRLRDDLNRNQVDTFGAILHEGWMLKKSLLADISENTIDAFYTMARNAGALGGKILGAGAGGFLMLYGPPETHPAIEKALAPLRRIPVQFEALGSQIIFSQA